MEDSSVVNVERIMRGTREETPFILGRREREREALRNEWVTRARHKSTVTGKPQQPFFETRDCLNRTKVCRAF